MMPLILIPPLELAFIGFYHSWFHCKKVIFQEIIARFSYHLIFGHHGVFARGKTLLRPLLLMATHGMPLQRHENLIIKGVGADRCVAKKGIGLEVFSLWEKLQPSLL